MDKNMNEKERDEILNVIRLLDDVEAEIEQVRSNNTLIYYSTRDALKKAMTDTIIEYCRQAEEYDTKLRLMERKLTDLKEKWRHKL